MMPFTPSHWMPRPFRFAGLAVGLLAANLLPSAADAVFTPTSFHEELWGCLGGDCSTEWGPGPLTPESAHVDRTLQSGGNYVGVSASAQTNGGTSPEVDAALSYDANTQEFIDAGVTAQIIYEFRVDHVGGGAPPVSTVPLVFIHRLEAGVTTQGQCEGHAEATLFVNNQGMLASVDAYYVPQSAHKPREYVAGALIRSIPAGGEQFIALTAEVSVAGSGVCGGSVMAVGDPIIEFPPEFPYAHEYEIVVEPGSLQDNPDFEPTPVPEPAHALLLVTGALVLLGAGWVRQRAGQLAHVFAQIDASR